MSVTGFDDLFFAAYLSRTLTTVRQPMRRMGQMAMENLFKLMSGEDSVVQVKVEAELVVRGSTGRVRTNPGGQMREFEKQVLRLPSLRSGRSGGGTRASVRGGGMGESGARNGGPTPLTPLSVFCKETPIIPAIRKPELVEQAITSRSKLIYLLTGDPDNVESMIRKIVAAEKIPLVNLDLLNGFSRDKYAVNYLKRVGAQADYFNAS